MTHDTPTTHHRIAGRKVESRDGGYTMIELLFGVVILVIFVTASVLAVFEVRTAAANNECQTHAEQLSVAAQRYLAQSGTDTIEPTGDDGDRFERTLVEAGLLLTTSPHHDVSADGAVISTSKDEPSC